MLTWNNPTFRKFPPCPLDSYLQENGYVRNREPEWYEAEKQGWTWTGQLEQGDSGTAHYQFCLNTNRQVRWSAVKKVFPQCHIEKTKNIKKAESYVKKVDSRLVDKDSQTETPKYTTKDFWEDLALVWPEYANSENEDIMSDFDLAVKCLIDSNIPCHMLAVQPQVRKAFLLYGTEIMAQYARLNPAANSIVESNGYADEGEGSESGQIRVFSSEDEVDEGDGKSEEDTDGEDDGNSGEESETGDSESD